MGFFANLKDHFTNAEFTVAPQKKLKTISADFLKAFNLALVFYKGVQIADGTQANYTYFEHIRSPYFFCRLTASAIPPINLLS